MKQQPRLSEDEIIRDWSLLMIQFSSKNSGNNTNYRVFCKFVP